MRSPLSLGSSDDLAVGQGVIVAARWMLVAAGLVLALVAPPSAAVLAPQVLLVLVLAVCNFALQAQLLRRRRTLAALAYAASAADLAIISALVVADGGWSSGLYVFYFPAVLALSVAFPRAIAAAYVLSALAAIASVAYLTASADAVQDLVIRCLMLLAVALCGAVYSAIEAGRRRGVQRRDEEVLHATAG